MVPRPFRPTIQWENISVSSVSVPIVVHLTDDDGDGTIGPGDIPDVVTASFQGADATHIPGLVAVSGDDGHVLWRVGNQWEGFCTQTVAAAGDLDGDGTVEIAVLGRFTTGHEHLGEPGDDFYPPDNGPYHEHYEPPPPDGGVTRPPRLPHRPHMHREAYCGGFDSPPGSLFILSHEGVIERREPLPPIERRLGAMEAVTIADLDADGSAEVIASGAVFGAEGMRWSDPRIAGVGLAVGDIDLDGRMEIVTAQHAFEDDGRLKWVEESLDVNGHPAIGRVFDESSSGPPQVIVVDATWITARDALTGRAVWGPVRYASGRGAGPPTLADFDGDGVSEIGVQADHAYVVFDPSLPSPHIRWATPTEDRTPGTVGAAAFDFDGDGAADIAVSDECHVRILSGRDGRVLWVESNPSRTIWEYPVVADVDGDGRAELIVSSNERDTGGVDELGCGTRADSYSAPRPALRVFRDLLDGWSGTHATWNQHGYYLDGVTEGGRVPVTPPNPWDSHNTLRANPRYPADDDRPAPNLVVAAVLPAVVGCGAGDITLRARIENHGAIGVPAGVAVRFEGGRVIGTASTAEPIFAGGASWVHLVLPRLSFEEATVVRAQVDPGGDVVECDEHDNAVATLRLSCPRIRE